jgi:dTDP-4-amino-4,6-dideoxyglucose
LPETERLVNRVLCLPTGTGVDEDQIARICQLFRFAVENGREISHKLGANA